MMVYAAITITTNNVKRVVCSDEPTDNYQQLYSEVSFIV